ncbi:MAG: ROK family protein [Candidatus Methanosuratus sp.]|nr:ROK family protein [Candidatus Methanosuratincola sp.]
MGYAVGLDIGGSWIRAALGDKEGKILRKSVRRVASGSEDQFISQVIEMVREVCRGDPGEVEGVGVGAAGRLDIRRGSIEFSPHTTLSRIPLKETIEAEFRRPAVVLNDCVAAVMAERMVGAGRGVENLVYIGIGTGIGAGIIVDGRVILGKDGNAHEVGHMIVDLDGRIACSCGGIGHWEAYTSGSGIPKYARYLSGGFAGAGGLIERIRSCGEKVLAKEVFSAAYDGDPFARFVIEEAAEINSKALANVVNLYDPQTVTIGGGLTLKNPSLTVDPIIRKMPPLCFNVPPSVSVTPLGEEAPLLGALLSAFGSVRSRLIPQL